MDAFWKVLLVVTLVLAFGSSLAAAEPADKKELLNAIKAMKATIHRMEKRLAEVEDSATRMTEADKAEMKKVVKDMVADAANHGGLPKWLDALEFFGDFRLRYQGNSVTGLTATAQGMRTKSRNRFRGRLRVGLKKYWLDRQMEVGFRLGTGNSEVPTSTNQTFDDYFDNKSIWVDLMWAKYKPKSIPGLTIIGGKMKHPMVHTDIWDSDVNPEGIWAEYRYKKIKNFEPFANVGYWTIDDYQAWTANGTQSDGGNTRRSPDMWSYQVGFDWKVVKDVKWTSAAAFYDSDGYDIGSGPSPFGGNTIDPIDGVVAGGSPRLINFTNKVGWKMFKLPWGAYFDIYYNCGENDRIWSGNNDLAYAVGMKVGKNKKQGDWSASYQYKYIEANGFFGVWADADFGGTNSRGHVWGAKYNLTDFLTIGGKVFVTEPIHTDNWAQNVSPDNDIWTVQADLVWKF